MTINYSQLDYFQNLTTNDIPDDANDWLASLSSATVIDFIQKDKYPWRVVVTLLHGNEPSGFFALHQLIKQDGFKQLKVNVRFILGSIEAAKYIEQEHQGPFSHRYLPGGMDLNRCFGSSSLSQYFLRAQMLASSIRQVKPEAIIDLHNTSGSSPAFTVSCHPKRDYLKLAGLFSDVMIVSHIRLGALMEQQFNCPVITVECGGAKQERSHEIAMKGLSLFLSQQECNAQTQNIEIIYQPMRLKLSTDQDIVIGDTAEDSTVTLRQDIEALNYHENANGCIIGWATEESFKHLFIENSGQTSHVSDYFVLQDNKIVCHRDVRIFMATQKTDIVKNDCLFYFADIKPPQPQSNLRHSSVEI